MEHNELPLSVIMPSYNNEKNNFLETAIHSIFSTEFIPNECIIIDDCSTDNSLEKIKKLALEIPQITIIKNVVNLGAEKSRREGMQAAKNDYVALVDSDDFLGDNALKYAYDKIIKEEADIVVWQADRTDYEGKNPFEMIKVDTDTSFTGREACGLILVEWELAAFGLYKKDLYLKAAQAFKEVVYIGDELLARLVFFDAKKVMACEGKYFYRNNKDSVTQKKSLVHIELLNHRLWLLNFANKNNYGAKVHRQLVRKFLTVCKNTLRDYKFYSEGMGSKTFINKISKDIDSFHHLQQASSLETLLDTSTLMRIIKLHIYFYYIKIQTNRG